jgi:hypothetical protein
MMALCAGRGIAIFAEARPGASKAGQKVAARGSGRLCGMALSERNLFTVLIFCYFFIKKKVKALA